MGHRGTGPQPEIVARALCVRRKELLWTRGEPAGRDVLHSRSVAFSLWRAAFFAESATRTWPQAVDDLKNLLQTVLRTNTINFANEHTFQGWTAGYYLKNAKLR